MYYLLLNIENTANYHFSILCFIAGIIIGFCLGIGRLRHYKRKINAEMNLVLKTINENVKDNLAAQNDLIAICDAAYTSSIPDTEENT